MIIAIIQARTGSTRLPRKALRELHGKPMLLHQIERVRVATRIDRLVIATTDRSEDEVIASLAQDSGMRVFRGSESDVLDRFYQAAVAEGADQNDVIVRLTGDCPLHDPAVIDEVIEHFTTTGVDYTSTPANYPEGLDTEVVTFAALHAAWNRARLPSEREHVTPYIKNHPEHFTCDTWIKGEADDRAMHWSVDTEADFRFVEAVFTALYHEGEVFHKDDVLAYLQAHPEMRAINEGGTGYEGLEKSLKEDEESRKHNL